MNNTMVHEEFSTRCHKVLQVAKDLFQRNPDWVTFFREVLGVSGAARNVFPTNEEYLAFEQAPEYAQIQQMVASLRNRKIPGGGHNEPTRVITVRLPESLHEALKAEATDHKTSMNKLCISKLLQVLSDSENKSASPRASSPSGTRPVPAPSTPIPSAPVRSTMTPPPVPAPSTPVPAPSHPVPAPNNPMTRNPVPAPSQNPSPNTGNDQNRFGNRF